MSQPLNRNNETDSPQADSTVLIRSSNRYILFLSLDKTGLRRQLISPLRGTKPKTFGFRNARVGTKAYARSICNMCPSYRQI